MIVMNNYEVVFISTPVLSNEQYKKVVDKYSNFIKENGEIINHEDWGLRQLAYPIEKKTTGFYTLIEFAAPGDIIQRMDAMRWLHRVSYHVWRIVYHQMLAKSYEPAKPVPEEMIADVLED